MRNVLRLIGVVASVGTAIAIVSADGVAALVYVLAWLAFVAFVVVMIVRIEKKRRRLAPRE